MWADRSVVITGGSSGLGLELAKSVAQSGARLALLSRNPEKLAAAESAIRDKAPQADILTKSVDVADEPALQAAIQHVADELGAIDILINSAGILREGYFETLDSEIFRQILEINYFGSVNAVRAALPYLKQSHGRIVNIASGAGLVGTFGYTPYTASKYALVGFSESLRYEMKPQGVSVQVICPTEFDSPMVDEMNASDRSPENEAHTLTVPKTSLEAMTRNTLKAIESGRFLVVPGLLPKLTLTMARLLPPLSRWIGDRVVAKVYRGPSGSHNS